MPEKVSIREDLQIIQVESYGEISAEDLQASLRMVAKIQQERGLTRYLWMPPEKHPFLLLFQFSNSEQNCHRLFLS